MPSKKTYTLALILVLAIGLVAGIASYIEYKGIADTCPSTTLPEPGTPLPGYLPSSPPQERSGCEKLYSSGEGEILGIHPSTAAPVYFSIVLGLAVAMLRYDHKRLLLILLALLAVGSLLVPYFVSVELKLGIICGLCTTMHAAIIIGALLSVKLTRFYG